MHTDILLEGTEKYYGKMFRVLLNKYWTKWIKYSECYRNYYIKEHIRAIEFKD